MATTLPAQGSAFPAGYGAPLQTDAYAANAPQPAQYGYVQQHHIV